ncbi:hypothetical protein [Klebsiella michiganensis]|nr:hypothetical protein [Klebsiella michiganensis]
MAFHRARGSFKPGKRGGGIAITVFDVELTTLFQLPAGICQAVLKC